MSAPLMSAAAVSQLAGIRPAELDYWCRSGRIPGQENPPGRGKPRRFTDEQASFVVALATAARMRNRRLSELARSITQGHCPLCTQELAS